MLSKNAQSIGRLMKECGENLIDLVQLAEIEGLSVFDAELALYELRDCGYVTFTPGGQARPETGMPEVSLYWLTTKGRIYIASL